MKLVEYNINKVDVKGYKKSNNLKILEEFIDSGLECAKVDGFTQDNASHAAYSLNNSIKRYRFGGIRAISRNKEVFLIRVNA